jgi:IS4 transposase
LRRLPQKGRCGESVFGDERQERFLLFSANDFELPALVICELYKRRWQVKLFFKWINRTPVRITRSPDSTIQRICGLRHL